MMCIMWTFSGRDVSRAGVIRCHVCHERALLAALALPHHRYSGGPKGFRIKNPKYAVVSYFTERVLESDLTWRLERELRRVYKEAEHYGSASCGFLRNVTARTCKRKRVCWRLKEEKMRWLLEEGHCSVSHRCCLACSFVPCHLLFVNCYLILDTWYLMFDIWYLIIDIWYLIFGMWYLALCIWYYVFGIICLV